MGGHTHMPHMQSFNGLEFFISSWDIDSLAQKYGLHYE